MKKKALIILGVLIFLTPIGLFLTDAPAWGEWENEYYEKVLGFIPEGFIKAHSIKPIIPDYSIPGINDIVSYYLSAVVGAVLLFLIYFILSKIVKRNSETN